MLLRNMREAKQEMKVMDVSPGPNRFISFIKMIKY